MAEQIEKGIISEEALEEVAGGINVDKAKLSKALKVAGVVVAGAGALAGLGIGGKKLYDNYQAGKNKELLDELPGNPWDDKVTNKSKDDDYGDALRDMFK